MIMKFWKNFGELSTKFCDNCEKFRQNSEILVGFRNFRKSLVTF